jgi:hypothetical protein
MDGSWIVPFLLIALGYCCGVVTVCVRSTRYTSPHPADPAGCLEVKCSQCQATGHLMPAAGQEIWSNGYYLCMKCRGGR